MHYSVSLRPATHRYASRETHRHTPGEPKKPVPWREEFLWTFKPVGKNRVGCLSCCECNLYSAHDHTSWKKPLAVCAFECVCVSMDICSNCYMHWGQLALDTSLWSSLTFHLYFKFSGRLWEHQPPPFADVLWRWLAGIYTIWAMQADSAVSGHRVQLASKSGSLVKEKETGWVTWSRRRGGRKEEEEEANGRRAATRVLVHGLVTQEW